MKASATRTITRESGAIISVTVERYITDEVIYADGDNIKTGKKEATTTVALRITPKGGKSHFFRSLPRVLSNHSKDTIGNQDAHAILDGMLMPKELYTAIMAMYEEALAEVDSEEYQQIQAEEAEEKAQIEANQAEIAEMEAERRAHPGWCDKCGSYCYGDCESN